jgi:hypothetical protein
VISASLASFLGELRCRAASETTYLLHARRHPEKMLIRDGDTMSARLKFIEDEIDRRKLRILAK